MGTKAFVGAALCAAALIGSTAAVVPSAASTDPPPEYVRDPRILSSGARAWLYGPQPSGGAMAFDRAGISFGSNVDANDPSMDVAGGQSEAAIAAEGQRVVVAWNDATGLFWADSTDRQGSLTGVAVSNDGGSSFTDLVGLKNGNPHQRWFGDPSIVSLGGGDFLVSSLYLPKRSSGCGGRLAIAVEHVHVGAGGEASLGQPVVAAGGARCNPNTALLDKDFMAFDPVSRTLALSYARYTNADGGCGLGQIEVVTAHVPGDPATLASDDFADPVVIHHDEGCAAGVINQGAYPAVAPGGDVYVAWERNILSNLTDGDPFVYIMAAVIPAGATSPSRIAVVSRNQTNSTATGGVKSLDAMFIAGYNRGQGNDFPRVAWNGVRNRLEVVWNDASRHPLGDIWLKELRPLLRGNAHGPIYRLNDDRSFALHFLPAVAVRSDGAICTSWYDRRAHGADSSVTDYVGECRITPAGAGPDRTITTGPTDWSNTSTFVAPNFGDYTDAAWSGTDVLYAWSDGRTGVPQPFVDRAPPIS